MTAAREFFYSLSLGISSFRNVVIQPTRVGISFSSLLQLFFDFLLPRQCFGCGRAQTFLCDDCLAAVALTGTFYCPGCLQPSARGLPCVRCAPRCPMAALWVACPFRQPLVRRAVEAFKYAGVRELSAPLAALLERYLRHLQSTAVLTHGFDGIIAVPLHRTRYLFRGFNQAELLAAPISRHFGWPLLGTVIARRRSGRPQVGRGKLQRRRNVHNAFTPQAPVTGRRLLLLDDVVTTGSTLSACAEALRSAGAESVTALALAHG